MVFMTVVLFVWLVGSGVGLAFSLLGVREALEDLKVATAVNGARRLLAAGNLRAQLIRSSKLFVFLLAAGHSLLEWPPDGDVRRTLIVLLLTYATVATAGDSLLDRHSRRRVTERLVLEERQRAGSSVRPSDKPHR